jgi:hypothetical protein
VHGQPLAGMFLYLFHTISVFWILINYLTCLQLDVVSLYLLFLVQIIQSGLQVIYTMDEVIFIQNLVYYVERAYRTPDFGLWQRGSKYNDGTPEIHARFLSRMNDRLTFLLILPLPRFQFNWNGQGCARSN